MGNTVSVTWGSEKDHVGRSQGDQALSDPGCGAAQNPDEGQQVQTEGASVGKNEGGSEITQGKDEPTHNADRDMLDWPMAPTLYVV